MHVVISLRRLLLTRRFLHYLITVLLLEYVACMFYLWLRLRQGQTNRNLIHKPLALYFNNQSKLSNNNDSKNNNNTNRSSNIIFPLISGGHPIQMASLDYLEYYYNHMPYPPVHYLAEQAHLFDDELKRANATAVWDDEKRWIGKLKVSRNAHFNGKFAEPGCGYETNINELESDSPISNKTPISACPMFTPEGWSFQGFIQDTLPKLVQAYDILRHADTILIVPTLGETHLPIISDILKKMKLMHNVKFQDMDFEKYTEPVKAKYMLNACVAPPLHPQLFQGARKLIGGFSKLQVPSKDALVVFLTREVCDNCGRQIINNDAVMHELTRRYGADKLVLHKPQQSVEKLVAIFSRTKLMLGLHGGGMYNMLFATTQTKFLEIMPSPFMNHPDGNQVVGYMLGQSFAMNYWKFYADNVDANENNDVYINITLFTKLLDQIDSA